MYYTRSDTRTIFSFIYLSFRFFPVLWSSRPLRVTDHRVRDTQRDDSCVRACVPVVSRNASGRTRVFFFAGKRF